MYLEAGFTDYLSKPIEIDALERKLVQYLPESLSESGEEVKKENVSAKEAATSSNF